MIEQEFYYWLDKAPITQVLVWPATRAAKEIAQKAADAGVPAGRVTLWLWQQNGWKVGFAMARRGGEGAERRVQIIHGAPPHQDADKAQVVFEGERA